MSKNAFPLRIHQSERDRGWRLAEELGVSAANADQAMASTKPDVRRFVGAEGGFGMGGQLRIDIRIVGKRIQRLHQCGEIIRIVVRVCHKPCKSWDL